MWHVAAFYEATGATTLDPIAAVADQQLRVAADDVSVPKLSNLGGVMARCPSITDARLEAPSLRKFANIAVSPMHQQWQVDWAIEEHWMDMFHNPVSLDETEDINLLIAQNGVGDWRYGLVYFMDKIDPVPAGPIRTVRFTSSTTLVAHAWTACALTADEDLPAGRYSVVGATGQCSNILFFRLIFPEVYFRPGTQGIGEPVYPVMKSFRMGGKGEWGQFENTLLPQAEFLSHSADTAEKVWLDLVQVRQGPG